MIRFLKYSSAVLDYSFDWTNWLATSEVITAFTVTADTGLTVVSSSELNGVVTYWLSGGTACMQYNVTCTIVTNAGRTDERTVNIKIVER